MLVSSAYSIYHHNSTRRTALSTTNHISITTTKMTDNNNQNPGNFANRSKEEVQNIASKGGQTGTENSGFVSSMPSNNDPAG